MDTARVGRRIKAFRKLKGYTQVDFAKELDIPLSILGGIERGTREPSDEFIQNVANLINIDEEEILLKEKR